MTDSSTQDASNQTSNNNHSLTTDGLDELRSLLLGVEPTQLNELYKRLDNLKIQAEDVSQVLPAAIILRTMQDKQLSEAMVPTVEEAIQTSVKKDLTVISDAIFPVIGPASRKAVATVLETAIESLNQSLEHSLSLQSFKWRLEARQTGKTFAEVILLRTLLYRVEQVFLIHKTTGLALQHVVASAVVAQDADLVSAMLTAIQDFVRDSFNLEPSDSLQTLQFGELTIWIEQGPQALLAAVIRGNAPKELRTVFQEALEKIHHQQSSVLNSFQGDTAIFEASKPYLEVCLQTQYKPQKKAKSYSYVWALLGVIAVALGAWSFFAIRDRSRWASYLEKLNAQPGIVVTAAGKRHGKYYVSGLRDPLAADPIGLMKAGNVSPKEVTSRWEPYLSFYPGFIAERTRQLLQPPVTVSLQVDDRGILHTTGTAPHQWIVETRRLARTIPGVTQFKEDNLTEMELQELQSSQEQIEKQLLHFGEGSAQLAPAQSNTLKTLAREIQKLSNSAQILDKDIHIKVIGHTNKDGSKEKNKLLSQARADVVLSALVSQGIKKTNLSAVGVGTTNPLSDELTVSNREFNRGVSFQVTVTNGARKQASQP